MGVSCIHNRRNELQLPTLRLNTVCCVCSLIHPPEFRSLSRGLLHPGGFESHALGPTQAARLDNPPSVTAHKPGVRHSRLSANNRRHPAFPQPHRKADKHIGRDGRGGMDARLIILLLQPWDKAYAPASGQHQHPECHEGSQGRDQPCEAGICCMGGSSMCPRVGGAGLLRKLLSAGAAHTCCWSCSPQLEIDDMGSRGCAAFTQRHHALASLNALGSRASVNCLTRAWQQTAQHCLGAVRLGHWHREVSSTGPGFAEQAAQCQQRASTSVT